MLDLNHKTLLLMAEVAALPQWAVLLGASLAVTLGVTTGWVFWRQFRFLASAVELETRRAQSEFDLVSRDVFKARQDATVLVASRNQKI